jgi:hypothetical protein
MEPSQGRTSSSQTAHIIETGCRCRWRPMCVFVRPERLRRSGVAMLPVETITRGALMMSSRVVRSGPMVFPALSRAVQRPLTPIAVRLPVVE